MSSGAASCRALIRCHVASATLAGRGLPLGIRGASFAFTIVPPFWRTTWFMVLAWSIVVVTVGGAVRFFEMRALKRRMQALEREQALDRERLRISRDMHDEVGARLTEIAILSELVRKNKPASDESANQTERIARKSREVIDSISEIIWATNPKNDPLEDLVAYLRHYAFQFFEHSPIRLTFELPDAVPPLRFSSEARRNLFLAFKETLNNIVKHSKASCASVTVVCTADVIEIRVKDDGTGFVRGGPGRRGDGLTNMDRRMKDIGGTARIESSPRQGTVVVLTLPMASRVEE